ncbi:MAG: UbiA prenyltransferase family protein [Chitinophagaceae bacterium]|nr:UbiA prenyltransferase family protein [Chitinophagaceae bacterium]
MKNSLSGILQHLRIPFSFLLLPVFLFAYVELPGHQDLGFSFFLLLGILHLLVYPSSNAYNSLQDRDTGSIGLVKYPQAVPQSLRWITVLMDLAAIAMSFYFNMATVILLTMYILFSRLYSHRGIRLKRYPAIGFMTVFLFQGFLIYILTQCAFGQGRIHSYSLAYAASCLIGAIYPLSQIYQHQQDEADGVISISRLLGYRGTFLFSGSLFVAGAMIFTYSHWMQHDYLPILIFHVCQFPVITYFIYWAYKVWQQESQADFGHTMRMSILASVCMNACFGILFYLNR